MTDNGYGLRRPQVERTGEPADTPTVTPEVKPQETPARPVAALCKTCWQVLALPDFAAPNECMKCNSKRLSGDTQTTGEPGELMNRFAGDRRRYPVARPKG